MISTLVRKPPTEGDTESGIGLPADCKTSTKMTNKHDSVKSKPMKNGSKSLVTNAKNIPVNKNIQAKALVIVPKSRTWPVAAPVNVRAFHFCLSLPMAVSCQFAISTSRLEVELFFRIADSDLSTSL